MKSGVSVNCNLCQYKEEVFQRCKECLESAADDCGVADVLYVLSGDDTDPDNLIDEDIADEEKQLVKSQYYRS